MGYICNEQIIIFYKTYCSSIYLCPKRQCKLNCWVETLVTSLRQSSRFIAAALRQGPLHHRPHRPPFYTLASSIHYGTFASYDQTIQYVGFLRYMIHHSWPSKGWSSCFDKCCFIPPRHKPTYIARTCSQAVRYALSHFLNDLSQDFIHYITIVRPDW